MEVLNGCLLVYVGGHPETTWPARGEGDSQMTILLHKPYLVNVARKEVEEESKIPKKLTTWFMDDLFGGICGGAQRGKNGPHLNDFHL